MRWVLAVLVTSGLPLLACGSTSEAEGGSATSSGGDSSGGGAASSGAASSGAASSGAGAGGAPGAGGAGTVDRDDGCVAPPDPTTFTPADAFDWEAPSPTIVVTTANDAGAGSLRQALADAEDGDVVAFDEGLAGATIALDAELVVTRSITIDASMAPGLTLDAQSKGRVMAVEKNRDTTLVGLTFQNGKTDENGGALLIRQADQDRSDRRVEIVGCRFLDNEGVGGAVLVGWKMNAVVRDSEFIGNTGIDDGSGKNGGAISTRQNCPIRLCPDDAREGLTILRSLFRDNVGATSGAVYNILEKVRVEDSVFIGNAATSGSGAFFTDGGNTGGPKNESDPGEITLRRVWVEGSQGTGDGGAMLIWGYPLDVITLDRVVVKDTTCDCQKGGGVRLHGLESMGIFGSSFVGNSSKQQGGGLWIDGPGDLTIENSTFADNSCRDDAGGAINYNGSGVVRIRHSLFRDNFAGRACGAWWHGKKDLDFVIESSVFYENAAGQNIGERHMGFRAQDGGGNIEFVAEDQNRGRLWDTSTFADPMVGDVASTAGLLLSIPQAGSPLIDGAADSAVTHDARGGARDGAPDAGPVEIDGATRSPDGTDGLTTCR